ncbi:hypothetical protein ACMD2_21971, partial [Ananas comosus]
VSLWFGAPKSPRTSPRTSRISPTSYLVFHKEVSIPYPTFASLTFFLVLGLFLLIVFRGWREEPMDTLEVGWSLPLKRAAPTAKEDVEQFFKKPKVETQLVQPKSKYKPISLDDFDTCLRNIEEWLPEDVSLAMELERGCNDAYQLLRIRGQVYTMVSPDQVKLFM